MVDISERLVAIKRMIDQGDYFCINRGRQYGKTTTLSALKKLLQEDRYAVFSLSLENVDDSYFETELALATFFVRLISDSLKWGLVRNISSQVSEFIVDFGTRDSGKCTFYELGQFFNTICKQNDCPVVLMIDEIDQASNHASFLRLLGMLRNMYLTRDEVPALQSVILAGVNDIRNLKLKIRSEEGHVPNSPWNIAAPFNLDMSLSESGIRDMLQEYDDDHNSGINTAYIARLVRDYTNGYPFLVSRLCMIMDENADWTRNGFFRAVKSILSEQNTFFDNINKKIKQYPELGQLLRNILFRGESIPYNCDVEWQQMCIMYGYITTGADNTLALSSRIMETRLYNKFIDEDKTESIILNEGAAARTNYTADGRLDMPHILEHFCQSFQKIYGDRPEEFVEAEGRRLFLMYIRPIINGTGNYYIESATRDYQRTDIIIDYLGKQYILELKIWRGDSYNKRGEQQLAQYMDFYDVDEAYLLSFCFNKNKQPGLRPAVRIGERSLIEAVV